MIEQIYSKCVSTVFTVNYTASCFYTSLIYTTIRTLSDIHRRQPLAVLVFGPIESYYRQRVEMGLISDSGEVVIQYKVSDLLWEAYGKAATVGNALESFTATGLWTVHRQFYTECDFAPRELLRGSENPDEEDTTEYDLEACTVQLKKLILWGIIHTLLC